VLMAAAMSSCALAGFTAQARLDPLREIKLPVPSSPVVPGPRERAAAIKVASDQSLLALVADSNGNWSLVHVKEWWTEDPLSEVLSVRGWAAGGANSGIGVVDLQITTDGRYAVAIAATISVDKGPSVSKPDTFITVVDLEGWRIVGSLHTANMSGADFSSAQILNESWMALQDTSAGPSFSHDDYIYKHNRLISIPDLKLGPECISKRPRRQLAAPEAPEAEPIAKQNDEACADVLKISGIESERHLDSIINERNSGPASFETYSSPPPFESSTHLRYGLHVWNGKDSIHSQLSVFDASGRKLDQKSLPHLLCEGEKVDFWKPRSCGCQIEDVSERQHALLADCRIWSGDFDGGWEKEWFSVIRTDDFSEEGSASLPRDALNDTNEAIAIRDGHTYVLTLTHGEMLRVYAFPRRP
jgi:hypothetical protein